MAQSRPAEVVTVVWMLATFTTLLALLVALLLRFLLGPLAGTRHDHPLGMAFGLFLLTALVAGWLSLALAPLAYRMSQTPPPRAVTIAAVAIGLVPTVVYLLLAALER